MISGRMIMMMMGAMTIAALAMGGPARAATREQQSAACRGDAIRLCAFSIPNEAKITACMRRKIDQLSPKCRAMFEPARHAKTTQKGKGPTGKEP